MIISEEEIDKQLEEYEEYAKRENSFIKIKNNEKLEKLKIGLHNIRAKNLQIIQCSLADTEDKNECSKEIETINNTFKYIEQLEKEKEESYWQGYIKKQQESVEICKICKYRDKYRQLEADLYKANKIIDEMAKAMAENHCSIQDIVQEEICDNRCIGNNDWECEKCIKQYFEEKVGGKKNGKINK